MCGRFSQTKALAELAKLYHTNPPAGDFAGSYNVAPTDLSPFVYEAADNERILRLGRFGTTMTIAGKRFPLLNIQSEKLANRKDLKTHRCIIPATGFYEWVKVSAKDKQPYYFSPHEGIFSFAGIWKEDSGIASFSILTTAANDVVAPIHSRMPVILGHNALSQWLDPASTTDTLTTLTLPYPAKLMQVRQVSKAVNNARTKDASCLNSM